MNSCRVVRRTSRIQVLVTLLASIGFVHPAVAQDKSETTDARIERLKRELDEARKNPERQEYYRQIARAENAWRTESTEQAKEILGTCSPQFRSWEWHYLRRLFDSGVGALPGGRCVAYSPDGKRIATADGHSVKLWDPVTGRATLTLTGSTADVLTVAFSPDGKRLASGSADSTAKVWDLETEKDLATLRGHTGAIDRLAFRPDGTRLATASDDGTAKVWEITTGKALVTFSGHNQPVLGIDFSRDGKRVATAGGGVKVWDADNGTVAYSIDGRDEAVAFGPNGGSLATAGRGDQVRIYNADTGKLRFAIGRFSEAVRSLSFSADSKQLAGGFDSGTGRGLGRIRIWNLQDSYEILSEQGHSKAIVDLSFNPNGKSIASVGQESSVQIWNVLPQRQAIMFQRGLQHTQDFAASPKGEWLAATNIVEKADEGGVRIWDARSGNEVNLAKARKIIWPRAVAFSPDGSRISFSNAQKIEVWQIGDKKKITEVEFDFFSWASCLAFSPDGKQLAASTSTMGGAVPERPPFVNVWDASTGKLLFSLSGHSNSVNGVAFSPDGRWIASAGRDSTARIWDAKTGQQQFVLKCSNTVGAVAFSPDSQQLAAAGGVYANSPREMTIWDVLTGKAIYTMPRGQSYFDSISWSPDGMRLAVGGTGGDVDLIDTTSGQVILTLPFKSHVCRLVFSPDGRRLYCADEDGDQGHILYWDASPFEK